MQIVLATHTCFRDEFSVACRPAFSVCTLVFFTTLHVLTSCEDMDGVVWNNLRAHNYRNDLTRALDDEFSSVDVSTR